MTELKIQWETTTGSNTLTLPEGESCSLGRDEENSIVLPNSQVSRNHALITWAGDHFIVSNTSSKNPIGIHINDETHILQPGEEADLTADASLLIKPYRLQIDVLGSGTDLALQVECPNCKKANAADASFCKWCGHSLTGSQTIYIRR